MDREGFKALMLPKVDSKSRVALKAYPADVKEETHLFVTVV